MKEILIMILRDNERQKNVSTGILEEFIEMKAIINGRNVVFLHRF